MFDKLYDKVIKASRHKNAIAIFLFCTFLESFVSPIPPDIMIATMIAANPTLLWHLGWMAAIASVVGGLVGYCIGFYFLSFFGAKILAFYHLEQSFELFSKTFDQYGFWIICLKGITPIPFKLVAIAAGMAHFDLKLFFLASCIARLSRFYLVSTFIWFVGEKYFQHYLKKFFSLFLLLSFIAVLIGFGLLKFL